MRRIGAGLTTRASCLLAAGLTALVCGLVLGEDDLVRAGLLALIVPLVALLVVQRSRVQLTNSRSVEPAGIVSGQTAVMHLEVSNRSRLPVGVLMLEDKLPSQLNGHARYVLDGLSSRESRSVSYRLPSLPRGQYRSGPLRVRLSDPFHLVEILQAFEATTLLTVAPVVEQLPRVEPPRSHDIGDNAGSHSIGTHGADDASTREYRTGDDLRKIHWRSSARTGALMVRQEERPWQGQATILLDLRSSAHARRPAGSDEATAATADGRQRDSMEWAISAAASIGVHLLLAHRGVELISDLTVVAPMPVAGATQLLEHLAGARGGRQRNLAAAGTLIARAARDGVLIAVLGSLDPISLRLLAESHRHGASRAAFALLLDSDAWARAGGPEPGRDGPTQAAARVLRAAGWQVAVVGPQDSITATWSSLLQARTGASAAGAR